MWQGWEVTAPQAEPGSKHFSAGQHFCYTIHWNQCWSANFHEPKLPFFNLQKVDQNILYSTHTHCLPSLFSCSISTCNPFLLHLVCDLVTSGVKRLCVCMDSFESRLSHLFLDWKMFGAETVLMFTEHLVFSRSNSSLSCSLHYCSHQGKVGVKVE